MKRSKIALITLGFLWLAAVLAGTWALMSYTFTPGFAASPPRRWPEASIIKRNAKCATLVMIAHPQCPCTRASLNELSNLMESELARGSRLTAFVLFFEPKHPPKQWQETPNLLPVAKAIPGVKVVADLDGCEASRFNSRTSGQTILYGANGQLLFSGGITNGRGMVGDSVGVNSISSALNENEANHESEQGTTSVFGCPIITDGSI